jgi:hypothetical protein
MLGGAAITAAVVINPLIIGPVSYANGQIVASAILGTAGSIWITTNLVEGDT